jgi:hypothetical protein
MTREVDTDEDKRCHDKKRKRYRTIKARMRKKETNNGWKLL